MKTADQPTKPYAGFPLYPHKRGYWAKKIRGKTHYFGRIDDGWEAAEDLYNRQRDDLYAGRVPRESDDILTLEILLNAYLDSGKTRVANGELKQTSWNDAQKTAQIFSRFMGKTRSVESLRVLDFEEFRGHLLGRYGITTVAGHIARTKAMLKWAFNVELIDTQVRTGPNFKRPSAAHFRRHRASKPKQFYTAAELRLLHAAASPQMKAMILLGINAAMGNRDCGELEFGHIDLDSGWITYARGKTGIARRAQLWPETIEALQAVIAKRRQPADKSLRQRVLLTRCGQPWGKEESRDSPIAKEWAKPSESHNLRSRFVRHRMAAKSSASNKSKRWATPFLVGPEPSFCFCLLRWDDSRLNEYHNGGFKHPSPFGVKITLDLIA